MILFIVPACLCFSFNLKEKFTRAKAGSFIVTEQNETYTLLHIHTINQNELLLEEISIPSHLVTFKDWKKWVKMGAEGHTSWILYAIDLNLNQATECYSFTRAAHLPTKNIDSFLTTLFKLNLSFLPETDRLQTGPTEKPGRVGSPKPWGPPMCREGKKIKSPSYQVYTGVWPQDQSKLSGKKIVLYFDKDHEQFPFPYWMQAREGGLKFKIRATDSGENLKSPKTTLPRRAPFFVGGIKRGGNKAIFTLNAPLYYHQFKLFAIDLSTKPRHTLCLPIATTRRENEQIFLEIEEKKLRELLTPTHKYIWIVTSEDFDGYAEMDHPTSFTLPSID